MPLQARCPNLVQSVGRRCCEVWLYIWIITQPPPDHEQAEQQTVQEQDDKEQEINRGHSRMHSTERGLQLKRFMQQSYGTPPWPVFGYGCLGLPLACGRI